MTEVERDNEFVEIYNKIKATCERLTGAPFKSASSGGEASSWLRSIAVGSLTRASVLLSGSCGRHRISPEHG